MHGWVYVISNESMPGVVKVGYSFKDPKERADEPANTGAPTPYLVDYALFVEDPYARARTGGASAARSGQDE
jgi:hypothetical protein